MLQSDNMAIKGVLIDDRRVGLHTFERDSNNALKIKPIALGFLTVTWFPLYICIFYSSQ